MRTSFILLFMLGCGDDAINNNNNDLSVAGGDMTSGPDMAMLATCDLLAQDCPTGSKCAVSGGGGGGMMATITCVTAGTVTDGMTCTRTMGADNCAAGLVCSRGGVCRKYCGGDPDCGNGQVCGSSRGLTSAGACAPTCTPFGTGCTTGQDCSQTATKFSSTDVFFTCRTSGMTTNFNDCGGGAGGGGQCAAGSYCDPTAMWCTPLCDTSHACPANSGDGGVALSCMSFGSTLASDPGFCAQ